MGPLSLLALTCHSGKAASQDAMTANTRSLCQDEPGQSPGQCTPARLLVASAGPVFSLWHVLPWYWLILGHPLARPGISPPATWHPSRAGLHCVVATSPAAPQAHAMLVNLSLHVQPLRSPGDFVGLEGERRSQKPRLLGVQRPRCLWGWATQRDRDIK